MSCLAIQQFIPNKLWRKLPVRPSRGEACCLSLYPSRRILLHRQRALSAQASSDVDSATPRGRSFSRSATSQFPPTKIATLTPITLRFQIFLEFRDISFFRNNSPIRCPRLPDFIPGPVHCQLPVLLPVLLYWCTSSSVLVYQQHCCCTG